MTKATKVPGIPKVPTEASPLTRAFLNSVVEALEIRLGRRGDPKDRAVTLRELIESGLAKELKARPFDPNNFSGGVGGGGSIGFGPSAPESDTSVPPIPTGLTAAGAYSVINLFWAQQFDTYPNHGLTEVWSSDTDDRTAAIFVGSSAGSSYMDNVGSGIKRYYWIRNVSLSGIAGKFNSESGTVAETSPDVEYLLEQLTEAITSSELHEDLSTPIGNLPNDTAAEIAGLQAAVGTDLSDFKTEIKAEIDAIRNTPVWEADKVYAVGDLVVYDTNLYAANTSHTSTDANAPNTDDPITNTTEWNHVGNYTSLVDVLVQTETTKALLVSDYITKTDTETAISTATQDLAAASTFDDYTNTATLEENYYTKTDADSAISTATTGLAAASTFDDYTNTATLEENYYTKTDADSSIASSTMILKSETAGGFKAKETWSFGGSAATLHGWTADRITKSGGHNYLRLDSTGTDPVFRSPEISFFGGTNTLVQVKIKRVSGSGWHGALYYDTNDHNESEDYKKLIDDPTVTGEWVIAEWDMSSLTNGGNDWTQHDIGQIRLDFGNTASDTFDIEWVTIGRNAPPKGKGLPGNRFIHDPFDEWVLGNQDVIADSTAPDGTGRVLRLEAGDWPFQADLIPIVKNAVYRVSYWAKPTSSNPGRLYHTLRQYQDSKGTLGTNNYGRSPYKPTAQTRASHNSANAGTDEWAYYTDTYSTADWAAGNKYFRPYFLDAYHDGEEPVPTGHWRISGYQVEEVTDLEATKAQIEVQAETIDGLSAKYTVKTDVNGHVAGFGLASTANDSGQITSEFIINADRFAIARNGSDTTAPSVPFSVVAASTGVPAGVYMNSAFIKNASITSAKIGSVDADTISTGKLDVANRITAGSINANLLSLDGVTLKNVGGGKLGVDKISANSIESGTIDATNVTITNLRSDNIVGNIIKMTPFELASFSDIGSATYHWTIWQGAFEETIVPRNVYLQGTGWGCFENDDTYEFRLQMKADQNLASTFTSAHRFTSSYGAYSFTNVYITGNQTAFIPASSTLQNSSGTEIGYVLFSNYNTSTNETGVWYGLRGSGQHSDFDTGKVFKVVTGSPSWVTVSQTYMRARYDYHATQFTVTGGYAINSTSLVEVRVQARVWNARDRGTPSTYPSGKDWNGDGVHDFSGILMDLR